jgi:hypothetical protein
MGLSEYRPSRSPELIEFNNHTDSRGILRSLELADFGISVCRVFTISFSSMNQNRGEHAHRTCVQFLFSDTNFKVLASNLSGSEDFQVTPGSGLLVPPYNWIQISSDFSNCHVVVLASEPYEETDYIIQRPS